MIQSLDALGYDLAGRAISHSYFLRSVSDGDVRGKGKAGSGIATSPTAWAVPNSSKRGKDGSALDHRKNSINEQRVREKNEMGGEIEKKCPYLEEGCLAVSRNGVESS